MLFLSYFYFVLLFFADAFYPQESFVSLWQVITVKVGMG